jgi:hypothetical protein
VKPPARTRLALAWPLWPVTVECWAAFLAVFRPLTLAVVADAVVWLVFLLDSCHHRAGGDLRRPANPSRLSGVPTTVVR